MCLVNFFFKGVGRREVFFTPISPGGSQPPAATSRAFGFGTKYACLLFPKGIFVNHLLEKIMTRHIACVYKAVISNDGK